MSVLDELRVRGLIHDVTDAEGLGALLEAGPITFYVGFDPTRASLHIGHFLQVMAMGWLQRAGHRAIAVVGGGTGRIGDPSGRDDERELLDEEALAANVAGLRTQLSRVLDLDGERGMLVDNWDWISQQGLVPFLRDVGKHFSVNQMIARESVRRRLEEREHGISYTEFSYQLLQAFDFAHLNAEYGCVLQGGGSDQWGNITAGVDLVRRMNGVEAFGFVTPLLERSDGKKMSASSGEAVWLDPEWTSPYEFHQWFLNLPDDDVASYMKMLTFLPLDDIAEVVGAAAEHPERRDAQRRLADEVTAIVHGPEGVERANRAAAVLFGDEPYADLDATALADAFGTAPSVDVPPADLAAGVGLLDLMVRAGAASSNGEARRLVGQGGVRINNENVADDARTVTTDDLLTGDTLVLQVGKKRHFMVRAR